MKKIDIGQTVTTVANIGVIFGIVFLALELQQNNLYLAEESKYVQLQNRIDMNRDLMLSPSVVTAFYLTDEPAEIASLQRLAAGRRVLLQWQWEYESVWWATQKSNGPLVEYWRELYRRTSVGEAWEAEGQSYNPAFVQFMEENVVN
jgi:hypothetical protein